MERLVHAAEHGIEIPYPKRDIYVKTLPGDEDRASATGTGSPSATGTGSPNAAGTDSPDAGTAASD